MTERLTFGSLRSTNIVLNTALAIVSSDENTYSVDYCNVNAWLFFRQSYGHTHVTGTMCRSLERSREMLATRALAKCARCI